MSELIEIIITLKDINIRLLFEAPPSLERVIEVCLHLLRHQDRLLQYVTRHFDLITDDREMILNSGCEVLFYENDKEIGKMAAVLRTLFNN
jgi:hypothetical protein